MLVLCSHTRRLIRLHGYFASSKRSRSFLLDYPVRTSSQGIHKLRVLPIGQVQPFLVLKLDIRRISTDECLLRILPLAIPVNEQHVQQTNAPAGDDRDLGRDVTGSVLGSESLGTDDVANARDHSRSAKRVLRWESMLRAG